jgi:hypothetical protein
VKYAAYRPGDPNATQEIKKCDQQSSIQSIDDFCGKQRRLVKNTINESSTHLQLLEHSTQNANQNFINDSKSDDCSLKYQKKRKKILPIPTAMDDFNRYLHEKKLHDLGIIKFKKSKSNKNIHTSVKFNHIVSVKVYYSNQLISFVCAD